MSSSEEKLEPKKVKKVSKSYPTGFDTVDEAYKALMPKLMSLARQHLIRSDDAIDAAHNAFSKILEYRDKHKKETKISSFLLFRETLRACRRLNKRISTDYFYEVPTERAARRYID